jgi:DNA primase
VVASSGTALTPDQIRIVNRLTKNITVLFDGDDAGIRASLRGIDLILEQGMNVKVVQFPDGEDPDSFAKSHSSSELEEFLQNEAKDFINFKVSLLLKDASKDPIKRAAVIREIVVSISKIPDRIQQEVYIKDCSRILDISEQVLYSELAQISSKKQREASQKRPQNIPSFEGLKPIQIPQEKINQLSILEKEIIRILLVYGNEDVDFTEEVMEKDDNGKEKLVKRRYKNLVSEEIYLHLHEDEIEFSNPIFQEIYAELIHQLNQSKQIDFKKLLNHSNPEVVNKVTSIVMDEEKYQLSNWESKNIYVSETIEILPKLVMDAVFNLRRVLISEKVGELMQGENPEIDLEIVKGYIELKKKLYQKLNRVV